MKATLSKLACKWHFFHIDFFFVSHMMVPFLLFIRSKFVRRIEFSPGAVKICFVAQSLIGLVYRQCLQKKRMNKRKQRKKKSFVFCLKKFIRTILLLEHAHFFIFFFCCCLLSVHICHRASSQFSLSHFNNILDMVVVVVVTVSIVIVIERCCR